MILEENLNLRFFKAHSCVEKAAMISLVKIRLLDYDQDYSIGGDVLKKAFDDDIEKGLIPFYVKDKKFLRIKDYNLFKAF